MTSFFYQLKGQLTIGNGLTVMLILAFILNRYQKRKLAKSSCKVRYNFRLFCNILNVIRFFNQLFVASSPQILTTLSK